MKRSIAVALGVCLGTGSLLAAENGFWFGGDASDNLWTTSSNWSKDEKSAVASGYPGDGTWDAGLIQFREPGFAGGTVRVPDAGVTILRFVHGYSKPNTPPVTFAGGELSLANTTEVLRNDTVNPIVFECPVRFTSSSPTMYAGLAFKGGLRTDPNAATMTLTADFQTTYSRLHDIVFTGESSVTAFTNVSTSASFLVRRGVQVRVLDGATLDANGVTLQQNGTALSVTGATLRARNLYLQKTDDYAEDAAPLLTAVGPGGTVSVSERLSQYAGDVRVEGTADVAASLNVGSTFVVNSNAHARLEHAAVAVGALDVTGGDVSVCDGARLTTTKDGTSDYVYVRESGRLGIAGTGNVPQPVGDFNMFVVNGGVADIERATVEVRRSNLYACRLEEGYPTSRLRVGADGVLTVKGLSVNAGEGRVADGGLLHILAGVENNLLFGGGRMVVADGGRVWLEGVTYADMQKTSGGEIVVEDGGLFDGVTIACRCAPNRVVVEQGGRMNLSANMIVTDVGAGMTNAELVVRGELTADRLQLRGRNARLTVDGGHVLGTSPSGGLTVTAANSVPAVSVANGGTLAARGMSGTLAAGSVSVASGVYFAVSNTFSCTSGTTFNLDLTDANREQAGFHFNSLSCTGKMRLAVTGPAAEELDERTAYYLLSVGDAALDPANFTVTYNGADVASDGSAALTLVRSGGRLALFRFGSESGNAAKVLHAGAETEYASFAAAFAALADGDTLTLLRECLATEACTLSGGKHVTVDGAGYDVYALLDDGALITVTDTASGLALKDIGITAFGSVAAVRSVADVSVGGAVNVNGNAQNVVLTGAAQLVLSADLTGRVGVTSGTGTTVFGRTEGFAGAENILDETPAYSKYGDTAQRLADGTLAWTGPETVLVWTAPAGSEATVAWGAVANSYTTWFTKPGGTEKVAWLNGAKAVFGKAGTCTGIRIASTKVTVNEIRILGETSPIAFTAQGQNESVQLCGDGAGVARIVTPQDVSFLESYTVKHPDASYPAVTKLVLQKPAEAEGTPQVRFLMRNSATVFYRQMPVELDGAALTFDLDRTFKVGGTATYAFTPTGLSGTGDLCLLSQTGTTNTTAVSVGALDVALFTQTGRTVVDGPISAEFVVQNALSAASSLVVTNGARVVGRYPLGGTDSTQPIAVAPDSTLEVQFASETVATRSTLGGNRALTVDGGFVRLPSAQNGHTQNDVPRDTWLLNGALIDSPFRMAFPDNNDYDQTIHSDGDVARTNVFTASLAARSIAKGTSRFDVRAPLLLTGGLIGSMPYVKAGTGTLILAGHDAASPDGATGSFTVSAGTLELNDASVLAQAALTVESGATLRPASGTVNLGALTLGADVLLDAAHDPISIQVAGEVSVDPSARAVGPNGEKFRIFVSRAGGGSLVTVGKGGSILIVK